MKGNISIIDEQSKLWQYLSEPQKSLIKNGLFLLNDVKHHPDRKIYDYSYVVFPFAKCYEGFLKQLFLDLGFITKKQHESDHFRVGKVLSPHLQRRLGKRSVYHQICKFQGKCELADQLWIVWRRGRNRIFHYFPHNLQAITINEAEEIIREMIATMESALRLRSG